jgi:hypothetical protein
VMTDEVTGFFFIVYFSKYIFFLLQNSIPHLFFLQQMRLLTKAEIINKKKKGSLLLLYVMFFYRGKKKRAEIKRYRSGKKNGEQYHNSQGILIFNHFTNFINDQICFVTTNHLCLFLAILP